MLRIHTFGALVVRDGDRPLAGAAAQPRRLAVLAVLARAGERGVTRDKLLALLWPDSPDESGRRALAQALYALRRDLGSDEVFLGTRDLRLNPELIASDAAEFETCLTCGDLERAASLYAGPFLDGFRVPGLEDFDRWIEAERGALALRHTEALESLAERCERTDPAAAVAWWRRLAATDPLSARVAMRLMRALDAAGDRAGALQHARIHEALMEAQLGLPPSPEVEALAERLRSEPEPVRAVPPIVVPVAAPEPALATATAVSATSAGPALAVHDDEAASPSAGFSEGNGTAGAGDGGLAVAAPPVRALAVPTLVAEEIEDDPLFPQPTGWRRWVRGRRGVAVAGLLAAGVAAFAIFGTRGGAEKPRPVLAIGRIAAYAGSEPAAPLADLLATDLARVRGVQVVSRARLFESMQARSDTTGAGLAAAARTAGATELVEGDVYPLAGGRLRLDLRRVDLSTGAVIAAYRLEGGDAVELADSGAARMAGDLPPGGGLGGVTTSSSVALRLYQNGLRAFGQNDMEGAARLFDAALAEDSTFAMAAWYAALSHPRNADWPAASARALRLAERASDRERLIIRAGWANSTSNPALMALADTLSTRYPREAAGPFYLGSALIAAGRPLEAVPQFRRAAELDPRATVGSGAGCLGCDARRQIVAAYEFADSFPAAAREAKRWTEESPRSTGAWLARLEAEEVTATGDEPLFDYRQASTISPSLGLNGILVMAQHLIIRGQYARADQLLTEQAQSGDEDRVTDAYWYRAICRREQGRLREALADAREARRTSHVVVANPGAASNVALLEAQILMEMGDFQRSAALFDSISRLRSIGPASQVARNRAWALAHRANALALMGDTARLKPLIDTVRVVGQGSFLARDQKLYHHLLGVLYRARGDLPRAAAEFRAAIVSPNQGYTRTNMYLATVLMRMGRPREAVAVLQPALRGSLESSNLYANRTDIHLLLGRAWQAAGQPDSAAVHFHAVATARAHGDPVILDTSG
jgi:DNA-binding SARP family transcriptional activator/tetratricopeptide (TPR) repeat protein/TolB-like protein